MGTNRDNESRTIVLQWYYAHQHAARREAEARRRMPVAIRWRQLNALIAFAEELGLDWKRRDEEELRQVRGRWVRIKETFERSR